MFQNDVTRSDLCDTDIRTIGDICTLTSNDCGTEPISLLTIGDLRTSTVSKRRRNHFELVRSF